MVIKLGIAYTYYVVSFSTIPKETAYKKKLDKILSILTKEICYLPKNMATIFTHFSHEDFGINTASLPPDYKNYTCKQLIHAQIDHDHLGQIYQEITKHDGSFHLPHLKYQACSMAQTLYLLEWEYEINVNTNKLDFPLNQTLVDITWKNSHYKSLTQE